MQQLFINLPVNHLESSKHFYTQIGFVNKPLFSDNTQQCMVWNEMLYVMLMTEAQFIKYSRKNIPDTKTDAASFFTLLVESIDMVNEMVESGLSAGGKEPIPMLDEGFMQLRRIEDLDGHIWDVVFMDVNKFNKI